MRSILSLILAVFGFGISTSQIHSKMFLSLSALLILPMKIKRHYGPVHVLFGVFMAWACLSCYFSENPAQSFLGHYLRQDGWIMWAWALLLACAYHDDWHKNLYRFQPLHVFSLFALVAIAVMPLKMAEYVIAPGAGIAGLSCILGVIVFHVEPWLAVLALPKIIQTQCRSALIALVIGIIVSAIVNDYKKTLLLLVPISLIACLIISLFALGDKFSAINFATLSTGTRSNLILQASELSRNLPVMGYGMDGLEGHLNEITTTFYEKGAILENVHNFSWNLILQTGWIGYVLFLLPIGYVIGKGQKDKFGIMACWIVLGLFNPVHILATILLLIYLLL